MTALEVEFKGRMQHISEHFCAIRMPWAQNIYTCTFCVAVPPFHDMTALEVELKGRSIALNVVLHPYAMYLPGSYLVGTTVKRLFTVSSFFSIGANDLASRE